ncbi:hypothetical protein ACUH97_08165 [Dermabacteraceae bacterium P13088]
MAIEGFALKPGTVNHLRRFYAVNTDGALAALLEVDKSTVSRAREAEQNGGHADKFVSRAIQVTGWPWSMFYAPTQETASPNAQAA